MLHFFYDAQSHPAKVSYNDALYICVYDLQRDIVGLLDTSDALMVEYRYDAWSKAISTTGRLAATPGKQNLKADPIAQSYMTFQRITTRISEEDARKAVLSATEVIDLKEADLGEWKQSLVFNYSINIRRSRLSDAQKYRKGVKAVSWWRIF